MNTLMTAIVLTGTLVLVQACSLLSMAEQSEINSTTPSNTENSSHLQSDRHQSAHNPNADHADDHDTPHSHGETSEPSTLTEARLIAAPNILANQIVPLAIHIQRSNGEVIQNFDVFQEKLMHLIVVSDDLQFFEHIHPEYKQNGHFEFAMKFPQSGGYTMFSDYKPTRSQEQISVLKTRVSGTSKTAPSTDFTRIKNFGTTKVELMTADGDDKALTAVTTERVVKLTLDLKDTATNQPVSDLQTYLGEQGHLVIIRQPEKLTQEFTSANYIHAHALKSEALGQVAFIAKFPQAGKYKLWGQFNRGGKVITSDFWVNVK